MRIGCSRPWTSGKSYLFCTSPTEHFQRDRVTESLREAEPLQVAHRRKSVVVRHPRPGCRVWEGTTGITWRQRHTKNSHMITAPKVSFMLSFPSTESAHITFLSSFFSPPSASQTIPRPGLCCHRHCIISFPLALFSSGAVTSCQMCPDPRSWPSLCFKTPAPHLG